MNRAISTMFWSLGLASAIVGGCVWLFEFHWGWSVWDSFLWWWYPFFWVLLAGGLAGELNKLAVEQDELHQIDRRHR